MMAMAQLLNIGMPGSYELTFPPQNPELPGGEGPGKGPGQSGVHSVCPVVPFDQDSHNRHRDTYSEIHVCS